MKEHSVAVGIIVWNGANTISGTLDSLLNQTFKNFQIYILDNQSTDGTQGILRSYAEKDSRIEFHVDTRKRDIAQAQKKIFDTYLSKHDFCMFSCDDDLYQESYMECILAEVLSENLDLVYAKFKYINDVGRSFPAKNSPLYSMKHSSYRNARDFLFFRNCVPIFFGIFRVASLKNSMPYFKMVDSYGFNHENLMIFHFLLRNRVGFIESQYFYYRAKERIDLYRKRGYFFSTSGSKKHLYTFVHNLNVSIEFAKIISNSNMTWANMLVMYGILPAAYIHRTFYALLIYPFFKKLRLKSPFNIFL